jgi:TetR/AcrR family transcriptional regulator, transcriptional repressor for nem operon
MASGRKREFVIDDVLRKASEKFAAFGFNGTTLSDLEEAMGIGRQSIYETFGDKRKLYLSCLERYRIQVMQPLLREIRNAPEVDRLPRIVMEAARRSAFEVPSLSGLLVGSLVELQRVEPELARIADRLVESLQDEIACRFAGSGSEVESSSASEAADLAAYLVAGFLGVLALARGERSARLVDGAVAQTIASFPVVPPSAVCQKN